MGWGTQSVRDEAAEAQFQAHLENCLRTLAQLFANEGSTTHVAVLAEAEPAFVELEYDNWNGGTYYYGVHLKVPARLYFQVEQQKEQLEKTFTKRFEPLLAEYPNQHVSQFTILPEIKHDENWRENAKGWLSGKGINNQGKVRSDNIASRECDGLLFRSEEEINLYNALKRRGVSFAPLPVFIRGGEKYRRIEPDFVILKSGVVMIIEVDGDTVHTESPVEAHDRTTMLAHEGAHVERVKASECRTPELAAQCAQKLLGVLAKLKDNV